METTTEVVNTVVQLPAELYLSLGVIAALLILIMFSIFYNR